MDTTPEPKRYSGGALEWQKQRLKPGAPLAGSMLTSGFGPDGKQGMYLPSARSGRRYQFKNGKPFVVQTGGIADDPELMHLRDRVLRGTAAADAAAILFYDTSLIEYSAALLSRNYNLSDEDLELLHSGSAWHEPIMVHALGGKDARDKLQTLNPDITRGVLVRSEQQRTAAGVFGNETVEETIDDDAAPNPFPGIPIVDGGPEETAAVAEYVRARGPLADATIQPGDTL